MVKTVYDSVFHLVLMAGAGGFMAAALNMPSNAVGGSLSPASFPVAISGAIIALLLVSLLKGLVSASRSESNDTQGAGGRAVLAWFLIVALLVAYGMLMETLGYVVTTALFLFGCVGIISELSRHGAPHSPKRIGLLAAFSIGVAVLTFAVFSGGFNLVLPTLGVMGV